MSDGLLSLAAAAFLAVTAAAIFVGTAWLVGYTLCRALLTRRRRSDARLAAALNAILGALDSGAPCEEDHYEMLRAWLDARRGTGV